MSTRKITVNLTVDDNGAIKVFDNLEDSAGKADRKVDELGKSAGRLKSSFGGLDGIAGKLGGIASIAGGFAIGQGLTQLPGLGMAASNAFASMELNAKKAATVFGSELGSVQAWAAENAAAMGLSKRQATDLAASMADLLIPMGMTREAAAEMSTETIGLAGALSEWSGGKVSAAAAADILTKAYLGETDGLKGLGISISAADVAARLALKGQEDLTGAALQQAQALAVQELILEKSTDAQAAYADGAGGAARKSAEMRAKIQEAKESLVTALAPAITTVTSLVAKGAVPAFELFGRGVELASNLASRAVEAVKKIIEGFRYEWEDWESASEGSALFKIGHLIRSEVMPALQEFGGMIREKVIGPLKEFADWFSQNEGAMQAAAVGLGTVLAVAFAALAVSAGSAAVAVIAATAPLLAIAAVVAGVGAGVFLLIKHWDDITARFPVLGELADGVKAQLESFASWVQSDLIPAAERIGEIATVVGEGVVKWFREHWPQILDIVKPVIDQLVLAIETIATVVRDTIGLVVDLIQGDWAGAWENAKQIVGTLIGYVEGTLGNLWALIRASLSLAKTVALELADAIAGPIRDLKDRAIQFGKDVVNGIWQGIQNLKDWLLQKARDFAQELIEILNPKNWFGSPQGIHNWFPYYLKIAAANIEATAPEFERAGNKLRLAFERGTAANEWSNPKNAATGLQASSTGVVGPQRPDTLPGYKFVPKDKRGNPTPAGVSEILNDGMDNEYVRDNVSGKLIPVIVGPDGRKGIMSSGMFVPLEGDFDIPVTTGADAWSNVFARANRASAASYGSDEGYLSPQDIMRRDTYNSMQGGSWGGGGTTVVVNLPPGAVVVEVADVSDPMAARRAGENAAKGLIGALRGMGYA